MARWFLDATADKIADIEHAFNVQFWPECAYFEATEGQDPCTVDVAGQELEDDVDSFCEVGGREKAAF